MGLLGKALFDFTFKRSQAEFKDDSKMAGDNYYTPVFEFVDKYCKN